MSLGRRHTLCVRLQAVEQRLAEGDIEGLLTGSEAVPDELAQRILQADAARVAASGQRRAAQPSSTTANTQHVPDPNTAPLSLAQTPDSTAQSASSSATAYAAAVEGPPVSGSAALEVPSVAATVSATEVAPAQQHGSASERRPVVSGDTDRDVFVAKLTLEALAKQREAAAQSLEARVWPITDDDGGSGAASWDDTDLAAPMDWQSELELIKRTGETWERRRARVGAERAAAAYAAASSSLRTATHLLGSTAGSDSSAESVSQLSIDHSDTGTAEVTVSQAGTRVEELDVIDLIAAGSGYQVGGTAGGDAWLDDESDDDVGLVDVTVEPSVTDWSLTELDQREGLDSAVQAESEQTRADGEPWADFSNAEQQSMTMPWQRPGHERYVGQSVKASPWQPTSSSSSWRAMAARLEAELEERSAASRRQRAPATEPLPPRSDLQELQDVQHPAELTAGRLCLRAA